MLQWERGFGNPALGCEEVDRMKACRDRSRKVCVEELAPRVGTARSRLEKAQKAGWCRNTQMVRDRGCGFIRHGRRKVQKPKRGTVRVPRIRSFRVLVRGSCLRSSRVTSDCMDLVAVISPESAPVHPLRLGSTHSPVTILSSFDRRPQAALR